MRRSKKLPPGRFSLNGKGIHCPHCDGTEFIAGEAQLNTALATLIDLDWVNKSAAILTCTACGQIQWYATEPMRTD